MDLSEQVLQRLNVMEGKNGAEPPGRRRRMTMKNEYDNEAFFTQYARMPRSQGGLEAAGEWRQPGGQGPMDLSEQVLQRLNVMEGQIGHHTVPGFLRVLVALQVTQTVRRWRSITTP